jgi:hypothetical protein
MDFTEGFFLVFGELVVVVMEKEGLGFSLFKDGFKGQLVEA